MADSTITNLTAATTLDGTEIVPVVQGGANRKAPLSLLPPAVVGTTTLTAVGTMTAGKTNLLDATGGAFTATLPTPSKVGQELVAERVDTTSNLISFGGTIRGVAAVATMPGFGVAGEAFHFIAESLTSWRIAATHKPNALLAAQYDPLGAAASAATVANLFLASNFH